MPRDGRYCDKAFKAPASQMEICLDVAYHSRNSEPEKDANDISLIDMGDNLVPAV
jgi:hypothetical protein